ncbi:MAG: tetratricopeptide repeat protein [Oscillospiraceae bacterium]
MTEWTVVTVIIALVGLVAGVVAPLLKLNSTITRLVVVVENLETNVKGFTDKNSEAHGRIWEKVGEHDEAIAEHETRLTIIEEKGRKGT